MESLRTIARPIRQSTVSGPYDFLQGIGGQQVVNLFRNILRVIGNAFERFGDEDHLRAHIDVVRGEFHQPDELLEILAIERVDFLVPLDDGVRDRLVFLDEALHCVS